MSLLLEIEKKLDLSQKLSLGAFTGIPGESDPRVLSYRYQQRLKQSLIVYLGKIASSFNVSLNAQLEKVEHLDPSQRFSPEIFSLYVRIRDAYAKQDLQGIFDTLQFLRNLALIDMHSSQLQVNTILTEMWEVPFIADLRAVTHRDEAGNELTNSVRMLPLAHWSEEDYPSSDLKMALALIEEVDPAHWIEFQTYVCKIKLFSGRVMEGVSSPRFFGNIFLRLPHPSEDPVLFYFEHLIHEVSHLHLYAMMGEDPLVLNPDNERYPSPIRADKRPMSGIFHAVFVLARIVRAFRSYILIYPEHEIAKGLKKSAEKYFLDGFDTLLKHGKMTEAGLAICDSLKPCAFGK